MKRSLFVSVAILFSFSLGAQSFKNPHLVKTFHIASAGGWDYLAVSPAHDWLYVSHGTQVNILNKTTGDSVGIIPNTTGVHGIAFDVRDGKGYTSNGRLNTVTVFDINSNNVIGQIATGQNPDAILYEPFSHTIITCSGRSKNLGIIDPSADKLIDSIDVGGKPETAVSDEAGHLYVNIEDKNEIVQIDTKTFKVLNHWSISPAEGPTGLAYDAKTKRLFAGCEKLLVVLNAENGKLVTSLPIGDGCDGVAFDPVKKIIYTANGEGTMNMIEEQSANEFKSMGSISTKKGARTIALDPATHYLYLPTAEFEAQPADAKGRPKMIPGTFQVLVLGE